MDVFSQTNVYLKPVFQIVREAGFSNSFFFEDVARNLRGGYVFT